jgi:hypothetical protein
VINLQVETADGICEICRQDAASHRGEQQSFPAAQRHSESKAPRGFLTRSSSAEAFLVEEIKRTIAAVVRLENVE